VNTATARLEAEAASSRRGEEREREKRQAAERALIDLQRAERIQRWTDPHPDGCPSPALEAAWEPIAQRLREWGSDDLQAGTYRTWIEPLHPHGLRGGVWVIACPVLCRDWIAERFRGLCEWACEGPVRFVICDQTSERSHT
jgi:hypothetical protein